MNITEIRRRLLLSDGANGFIVISSASTEYYVEINGTKYTSARTVPFKEDTVVKVYTGRSVIVSNSVQWSDATGSGSYAGDSSGITVFTARIGNKYTIDAINRTINAEQLEDVLAIKHIYTSGDTVLMNGFFHRDTTGTVMYPSSGYIQTKGTSSGGTYGVIQSNFSNYRKLYIRARSSGSVAEEDEDYYINIGCGTSASPFSGTTIGRLKPTTSSNPSLYSFDISGYNGTNYIHLTFWVKSSNITSGVFVYDIWME